MKGIIMGTLVGMLLASLNANANFRKFAKRCADDSLSPAQAIQRNKWAIKCAKSNGGQFHGMSLNQFTSLMYDVDFETMKKTKKERPEYPLFATKELTHTWVAPIKVDAGCAVPEDHTIVGQCTSSCYTGDQMILFADGYTAIQEAYRLKLQGVAVVDSSSTLGDISLRAEGVDVYTRSASERAKNTILTFKTQYGPDLKVTTNHPLVNNEGKIVRADKFKVGDALVGVNGEEHEIVSISSEEVTGYVYNLQPELSEDQFGAVDVAGQIVVAQEYLSGSSFLQNEGVKYLSNFTMRINIPSELL